MTAPGSPGNMVKVIEVYTRDDGKFAWRAVAHNNEIVATDGGQGYDNAEDAKDTAIGVVFASNYNAEVVHL